MVSLEEKIIALELGPSDESGLASARLQLAHCKYLINAQSLALYSNYDFSMRPGAKYLMAFREREAVDIFSLERNPSKLMILGAGLPADVFIKD